LHAQDFHRLAGRPAENGGRIVIGLDDECVVVDVDMPVANTEFHRLTIHIAVVGIEATVALDVVIVNLDRIIRSALALFHQNAGVESRIVGIGQNYIVMDG